MLVNIQFLRFAAATMVLLYHTSGRVRETGIDQGGLFTFFESVGFAGVDIFFFISGFIMFYTTTRGSGPDVAAEFLKRRAARIYSGYWPFFLAALLIVPWAMPGYYQGVDLVSSFFLWPVPLNELILQVSWTLTYEMYFYVIFAVLVCFAPLHRWKLILGLLAASLAYNLYKHFVLQGFSADNMYGYSFANQFLLSPLMAEFLAGALLAAFPLKRGPEWLAWLLLGLGIAGFSITGHINRVLFDGHIEWGFYVMPRLFLFGLPSALIVWSLVRLESLGRVAPKRFSIETGGASYAIYLSHTLFLVATAQLGLEKALSGLPALPVQLFYLAYSALIVVLSVLWFNHAERPLHRLFRKVLRVRRLNPGDPAPR
jgi:peptidoglycan/LPS O-acetylase OafA/YrhL